ncbi:hypothetical protein [Chryseobacterium sp. 6424]|uniref:hypothetical protein n=1 Tax=Chryseobacterium sp. 6424 TaxID=2039166 RepID=UPI001E63D221|nr:hypothetical protein [Chryseobacterium sp. 6424]
MKNLIKTLALISLLIFNYSCAQTTMKSVADARNIEINKKEFVGKPLSYLVSKMDVEVKSIKAFPNKNANEVNRITFRYVTNYEYKKTSTKEIKDRPTQLTIVFNQNWEMFGERCMTSNSKCVEWTKEDAKNLGDLIVYDIYVLGKN